MSCTQQFPILPLDVERLILECISEHDLSMALSLVRLSRSVRRWIDPIIYRRIVIEYPSQAEKLVRTLEGSTKPASFFANHVKTICIAYGIDFRHATKILSACSGANSLACWIEPSHLPPETEEDLSAPKTDYLSVVALSRAVSAVSLRPKRLSVTLSHLQCLPDPDFSSPLLDNATHLDIYQGSQYFRDWSWKGLSDRTNLTHISFDLSVAAPLDTITHVLSQCPQTIQVCLVLFSTRDSMVESVEQYFELNPDVQRMMSGAVDSRIVIGTSEPLKPGSKFEEVVVVRPYEEVLKDWSYTADGQNDIWQEAENIIQNRSRSQIELRSEQIS